MNAKCKSFLVSLAIGAVLAAVVYFLNRSAGFSTARLFCDAFFVAGVIITGCGGLAFVRNQGFFDIMSYGIKTVFHIHLPWTAPRTPEEGKESFVEYKERKRQERKSPAGSLLAGGLYLVLAALMLLFC